jgi:hypothetical protein
LSNVPFAVRTTQPHNPDRRFTVLYQSDSGMGKTHCALTWPNPGVLYYETNMATLEKFKDIPYILGEDIGSIENLEMRILPMLETGRHQELFGKPVIDTIVLDSVTECIGDMVAEIQGTKERLSMPDFGRLLSRGEGLIKRFVDLAKPRAGRPRYNFVATVHLRDVTDEEGALIKVRPAIPGQLKDVLGRLFDTVLVNKIVREETITTLPNQPAKKVTTERRVVWSVPQDKYHSCKDGVGGGELKVLPSVCDGTWPSLRDAWGIKA